MGVEPRRDRFDGTTLLGEPHLKRESAAVSACELIAVRDDPA